MKKQISEQKRLEHDKWLRKQGVHPEQLASNRKKRKVQINSIPSYKTDNALPLSNSIESISYSNEKDWQGTSKQYVVGQLYNKGGLQVMSVSDTNDPATGKRRN